MYVSLFNTGLNTDKMFILSSENTSIAMHCWLFAPMTNVKLWMHIIWTPDKTYFD